ncbi:MAG: Tad domain-containing protein [Dehalococcoidia bacterium]
MRTHRTYNFRESGQSLVLFAVLLPVMAMIVALVTDVGMLTVERRRLQNAADASALAGARMLPGNPDSAVADVEAYAGLNDIEDDEIVSIEVTATHVHDDTIEVELTRDVGFNFATLFGVFSSSVTVRATALTGGITGVSTLAPFGVEEDVFAGLDQGDTTTLKYNATSGEDGNFLPLVMDAPGSDEYGENIVSGSEGFLCSTGFETENCPSEVSTQPGNVIGKTKSALDWIFENTSESCDTYDEVLQTQPGTTRLVMTPECNRFSNPTAQSYQLIIVPVITNLCNGSCDVTVLEFALFFIESYSCGGGGQGNSCDLVGRYARAAGSVEGIVGAYDPDGSVKSVRLIK